MDILYILLVLLAITRIAGELVERVGQPALVGEIIGGILVGVVVGAFSETFPLLSELPENEVFKAITELGMFFLMLYAGLELVPADLAKSSRSAIFVALGGMLLPLAMGLALGWLYLPESSTKPAQMLFIGTALAITAVPVTVKVLMDIGQLKTRAGQAIVSSALIDDVFGLILLAVLTGVIETGETPGIEALLILLGKIAAFFIIAVLLGQFVFPAVGRYLKRAKAAEFEFSALLVAALTYAVFAELLGLHFILGAFLAGLFFRRHTVEAAVYEDVEKKVSGVTNGFLAPVFFASIGMHLSLQAIVNTPLFLVLLIGAAFVGKLAGSGIPAYLQGMSWREAVAVGFGMSGRGAVELIIAGIALAAGLFSTPTPTPPIVANLFSAVVIMAVVTTLVTPIGLRYTLRDRDR